MSASLDFTTAAVQTAQTRRRVEAEALHAWYIQQRSIASLDSPELRAEYLRRAQVIDGGYESEVEPYRQSFLAGNPGQPLPRFLEPGFQSFVVQLESRSLSIVKSGYRFSAPAPAMPVGTPARGGRNIWVWILMALVVFVVFLWATRGTTDPNTITSSLVATTSSPKVTPYVAAPAGLTACESAMKAAAKEPDSSKADPLILNTLQVCKSKSQWVAALKKYPAAMGMYEVTGTEWTVACMGNRAAPACR